MGGDREDFPGRLTSTEHLQTKTCKAISMLDPPNIPPNFSNQANMNSQHQRGTSLESDSRSKRNKLQRLNEGCAQTHSTQHASCSIWGQPLWVVMQVDVVLGFAFLQQPSFYNTPLKSVCGRKLLALLQTRCCCCCCKYTACCLAVPTAKTKLCRCCSSRTQDQ